jgi:hypothetical protein
VFFRLASCEFVDCMAPNHDPRNYTALPQKSEFSLTDYDRFSVMPKRGNGLQPRVAASATLGNESNLVLNRNAVASA